MQRKKFVNALILSALSLTACTEGQNEEILQSREADDWLKAENLMSAEAIGHLAANGLVLKGCEYLGEIDLETEIDELISYWLADDNYFVTDLQIRESSISFDVRKIKDMVKDIMTHVDMSEDEWRERSGDIIARALTEHPDPVIGKAKLFWNYKGLDFSTICALSRKDNERFRIAWDNISSNILLPPVTIIRDLRNGKWVPRSSQTRSDAPFQTGRAFTRRFPDTDGGWGAEAGYVVTIFGYYGRDGNKAIAGDACNGIREIYKPYWTADGQVERMHLNEGSAVYEFAWAASNDIANPVSISYRGPIYGFEIDGKIPGMWDSGFIFFTASDLQPVELDR